MKKFALVLEGKENTILKDTYTKKEIEFYKMDFEEMGIKNLKIIELNIDK